MNEENPTQNDQTGYVRVTATKQIEDQQDENAEESDPASSGSNEELNKAMARLWAYTKVGWSSMGFDKRLELGIAGLGLAALVVYTIFSILQWAQIRYTNQLTARALDGSDKSLQATLQKMQLQVNEMHSQVGESQKANGYTFDIIRGTQSAVLTYSSPFVVSDESTFDNAISINIGNAGKVNATNVTMRATIVRRRLPSYTAFGRAITVIQTQPILAPAGQSGSGMELTFNGNPFRGDREAILDRSETLEIRGNLTYGNGFGDQVSSDFCQAYLDVTTSKGFFPCYDFMRLYESYLHHQNKTQQ